MDRRESQPYGAWGIAMKKYNRLLLGVLLTGLFFVFFLPWKIVHLQVQKADQTYKVEISRLKTELPAYEEAKQCAAESLDDLEAFSHTDYQQITGFFAYSREELKDGTGEQLMISNKDGQVIIPTEKTYYLVTYQKAEWNTNRMYGILAAYLGAVLCGVLAVLLYIRQRVIKPFHEFEDLPVEIAKGNLTKPLEESAHHFFGKYLWGMNMLRETLEDSRKRELELVKEKKLLLMSLSHDVKTPLSAIKLYASALERELYETPEKKRAAAEHINENADEIERYIGEIVTASNEDFLDFEMECGELYIRPVLKEIKEYYTRKLELLQTYFEVDIQNDCMVYGDQDRITEVLQNIIENAIKYGDGNWIRLRAADWEDGYEICIRNSGCTLSHDELPHLFDSFFRGSNVGKNSGSGLGLYICRQLIHRMEGEILAEIEPTPDTTVMCVRIILRKQKRDDTPERRQRFV